MHDCYVQNSLGTAPCCVLPACVKGEVEDCMGVQMHLDDEVQNWGYRCFWVMGYRTVVQVLLGDGVQNCGTGAFG